ncbi:MAG: 2-amino-4-hydroxy-6-hydroxymethyldihydropteridine diphosphokinase [Actinomycetia bacterium]|nr:2-amino-4-hydroxy-6-hydroxymethyldihydropteridine diphosphokinase [Actinomycetes bacterium]
MRVAVALGSNLGDRLGYLQQAVDGLAAGGVDALRVSGVYETDPVGGVEQPDFLNAVVVGKADLDPWGLLRLGQRLEQQANRVRGVVNGPRTLDVDLLAVGTSEVASEELTVPHPRAAERAFVLVPWAEVDPDAVLAGSRVAEHLLRVGRDGVRPRPDLRLRVGHA